MHIKYFFFYGLFMSGYSNHEKFLKSHTISVRRACTTGSLYYLPHGCPAMTFGEKIVKGEVMLLNENYNMLAYLDALKGYYGEGKNNLWERIVQLVEVEETGEKVLAYIYVYPGYRLMELQTNAISIPDGDWACFNGDLRYSRQKQYLEVIDA